jgi:hypothetical protein
MPGTTIKLNFVGNLPGESGGDAIVVASDAEYCQASEILRGRNPDGIQSILVRNEHHFAWLKAQSELFGYVRDESVIISRTTPRILLGERWDLEIPDWLTDQLILENDLLQMDLPDGATSVAGGLLAPVLGHLPDKVSARAFSLLAEKLSSPETADQLAQPVLMAAWVSVLHGWEALGAPAWLPGFCDRLRKNPKKLWMDLSAWRLLCRYPESALDYALDPAAAAWVRTLPDDAANSMSLNPEGRALALDQISQLLATERSAIPTRQRFENLLTAVSGELAEEFDALESMLEKAAFDATQDDVTNVRRRFSQRAAVPETRLDRLALVVPPPVPSGGVTLDSDAPTWRRWALNEYLPYRWWQIQKRVVNPVVEESVACFSQWYCDNYAVVHSDPSNSSIQILGRWRDEILRDRVSLILLVDNLPWFFWGMFEKALGKSGLHRHASGYSFAPLPSHTAVCKPQLVSGKPDATGSDYLKLLRSRSEDEWQGRNVHYLMGVDQLASLPVSGDPYVALLNYLAADEALHRDAAAEGSSWTEQLTLLFGNLAKAVGDYAKQVSEAGQDFGLYVVTDHGATMILPEERKAADAQLTKKLFPNEKHRSATLAPDEVQQVPANLWSLGHRLESFMGDTTHFIPRGHNTVAAAGPRLTFSHGGATPEEVLVPSGLFRIYSANWATPRVRFVDLDMAAGRARFYIKRIVMLTFEVQNPNSDACRLEGIEIAPKVGEIRHFDSLLIPAKGTAQGAVSLYFSDSALNTEKLTLSFDLRIGQDALPYLIELPVAITSATTSGIDLKNLFS